jgi:hypothetical protein
VGSDADVALIARGQELTPQSGLARGAILFTGMILPQMPGPLAEHMQRVRLSVQVLFMSGFAQVILDSTQKLHDGGCRSINHSRAQRCSPRSIRCWNGGGASDRR